MTNVTNISDKASRLFQYLADLQAQNEKPVRRMSQLGSTARWIAIGDLVTKMQSMPLSVGFDQELAESLQLGEQKTKVAPGDLLLVKRPTAPVLPVLPVDLSEIWDGQIDNPGKRPDLEEVAERVGSKEQHAHAVDWMQQWDEWAAATRAHDLYQTFFDIHVKATQQTDEFELVLATGWLTWDLGPTETMDRPIFTQGLEIEMDKFSGAIKLRLSGDSLKAELEGLSAEHVDDGRFIEDLKEFLKIFEDHVVNLAEFSELGKYTANGISTSARFDPAAERVPSSGGAVLSWAPTLLLRPRRRVGLSHTFRAIAQSIELDGLIPAGLRPLVDPGYSAKSSASVEPGGFVVMGEEVFSPLPLNERQLRVVEHVDTNAHTIVQGPPGTGKTHMAAALLSHLLAQGKRVLVTAQTERALYELRDKLPEEIRELAVSVIGSSSAEMAELRTAIETIERKASSFDQKESAQKMKSLENELDALRERWTKIYRGWVNDLEAEQRDLNINQYRMPLPKAIEQIELDSEKFGWITEAKLTDPERPFPLKETEILELLSLLGEQEIQDRAPYRTADVLDPDTFPTAAEFERAVTDLEQAESTFSERRSRLNPQQLELWKNLGTEDKDNARVALEELERSVSALSAYAAPWTDSVQPTSNKSEIDRWKLIREEVVAKLAQIEQPLNEIRDLQRVSIDGQLDGYVAIAQTLRDYLESGKTLNVKPDGTVKVPMFGGSVVKAAIPFLNSVRLNGVSPTTPDLISKYLAHVSVIWELEAVGRTWPYNKLDPEAPAVSAALLEEDLRQFGQYLSLIDSVQASLAQLRTLGIDVGIEEAQQFSAQLSDFDLAIDAEKRLEVQKAAAVEKTGEVRLRRYVGAKHQWLVQLETAIQQRNASLYEDALEQGLSFHRIGLKRQVFDSLMERLKAWSPTFASALVKESPAGTWSERLYEADRAQKWLSAKRQVRVIADRPRGHGLADRDAIDQKIHKNIAALAAERAWSSAVGSERIDGAMRNAMMSYVHAVRRLGKGTGKNAELHRRDVRRHLDRARGAVPVWIMPIYKVVEQFDLQQDMFDVVIIDEASQAGVEAVFLQYLAPRVVVIGDDRQVSPAGVGVDTESLRKLARQYLYDFESVDAWVDPKRSLFDDANMRYGGRIALEEHRRCVPEIIEFSNQNFYRPNNIDLKPVREVQLGRLAPFRITHTPNGFEDGGKTKKVNRAEADILVSRLLACLEDPAYDGKTFGVISLLSTAGQASYIQKRLLTELPPQVWEERDLKIGAPADFQGAERDVVFLSMVSAVTDDARTTVLNKLEHEQRFNVAVSRAKDQVWLFHTIGIEDISNKEDLRYKLLQYAYQSAQASPESRESQLVPSDQLVEPFDSLFEQRVYNELVQRGYYVIPQFDVFGRRIDLVVQGSNGRLAVECDGDHWHSEEHAVADLTRQRELERLGWTFVRIFESDFYLEKNEQIQRVVNRLEELGISPGYVEGLDLAGTDNIEVVEDIYDLPTSTWSSEIDNQEESDDSYSYEVAEETIEYLDPPHSEPAVEPESRSGSAARAEERSTERVVASPSLPSATQLEEYEAFEGFTVGVRSASPSEIDEGLLQIIAVEGPIPEKLLFQRYVKAGGDQRVRDYARDVLRASVLRLQKREQIHVSAGGERIYRLEDQPLVRPRTVGTRTLDDITDAELAAHLMAVASARPTLSGEPLYRRISQRIGFKRFTAKMENRLKAVERDLG